MSCHWYEEQLANGNRLWVNGRPSPALLAHSRECERCAKLADNELELRSALLQLAETSQHLRPSASVKRNLLAELDAHASGPAPRNFALRFALAAAAVLCIAIGLLYWRNSRPQPGPIAARQPQAQPKQVAAQPTEPTQAITPKRDKPVAVAAARKPSAPATKAQTANDFYPIIMCDALTCAGPSVTVRVEMPASPLVNRGGGSGRTVMADLLVGEDGLVRGVRVLQ